MFRLFGMAVRAALPDLPLPETPPIFSLSDPARFKSTLGAAGFDAVEVHTVTHEYELESPEAFWELMSLSAPPAAALLKQLTQDDALRVRDSVLARVREEKGDGAVVLSNEAHVGLAIK